MSPRPPLRRLPNHAITIAVSAMAVAACVEFIDHETQHPIDVTTPIVVSTLDPGGPRPHTPALLPARRTGAGQDEADLELVQRSIANYDR
jgi:hypothetical protein